LFLALLASFVSFIFTFLSLSFVHRVRITPSSAADWQAYFPSPVNDSKLVSRILNGSDSHS
jgi:hypothetical protein